MESIEEKETGMWGDKKRILDLTYHFLLWSNGRGRSHLPGS
jgi:hypothetical protein